MFFCFLDNCIWNGSGNFWLLQTKYFSSTVNVVTSTAKIFHILYRDIFNSKSSRVLKNLGQKCSHSDFTSIWDPLTCSLSEGVLKRGSWDNCFTTSFAVSNFRNTSAMIVIFFGKCLKFNVGFRRGAKKSRQFFFVS